MKKDTPSQVLPPETGGETETISNRGCPQQPQSVAAPGIHIRQRVLALKVELDWKSESSKVLYNLLRDISWAEARYRNHFVRARAGEAMGWRSSDAPEDKFGLTKQVRAKLKETLGAAAYAAAEREVSGAFSRDSRKILAGQPLPEWDTGSALAVRGHKNKKESGVRLELERDQYVLHAQLQSRESGHTWVRIPITRHTKRDEWQRDILDAMVVWSTPISGAKIQIRPHRITIRLSYPLQITVPAYGNRTATLGPITQDGRLRLRTDFETRDYSSRLANIAKLKDDWDLIRRRWMVQIGRRKGHARIKRRVLSRMSFEDKSTTFLHTWTKEIADWLKTQGVSTLKVTGLETGDWPAYKFFQQLGYKCEALGIAVIDNADVRDKSGERAVKAEISKAGKAVGKRAHALRELKHQLRNGEAA